MIGWADKLRYSTLSAPWRAVRERQALSRYTSLLRQSRQGGSSELPSEGLAQRRGHRVQLTGGIRFAVFGTNDWEHRGLWQALEARGDVALFDYAEKARSLSGSAGKRRRLLGEQFLTFVNEQEGRGPVHLVFCYASGAYLDPEILQALSRRGIWTVVMALDDKQQIPGFKIDDLVGWQLAIARAADVYWTTWRAGIDWLARTGARPWYAPEGASPDFFRPVDRERSIDVLWVGRGYGPRRQLVSTLRKLGFDVVAQGPGWEFGPVPFDRMIELYSSAKVVLGMGGVGHTDRIKHLKGRDFEVPMCGAVYLTSFNPELAEHYAIGDEILCYSSVEECAEVLTWLLPRGAEQERIRDRARARALRDHTWERRIGALLELLRGQP